MKLLVPLIRSRVAHFLDRQTSRMFDTNEGKLRDLPNTVIWLVYIMCLSVLIQGAFDVILKVGGYTPWIVQFPWRVDFLFLTAISVLMGYQALVGIRRRELDVTRNSMQVGVLVETALVVGDIYFVTQHQDEFPEALPIRLPFIILTIINVFILLYIIFRLRLFRDVNGSWRWF